MFLRFNHAFDFVTVAKYLRKLTQVDLLVSEVGNRVSQLRERSEDKLHISKGHSGDLLSPVRPLILITYLAVSSSVS